MIKRIGSVLLTIVGMVVFLTALQTTSVAQIYTYDEAKQRAVDAYKKETIDFGTSRDEAMRLESKLHSGYSERLKQLCFGVKSYEMSRCKGNDLNCQKRVEQDYNEQIRLLSGELENHYQDRRDKINRYWDKAEKPKNRHDGRDGKRYVDKVPKPRIAFNPRMNYNGQIQVEIGGRRTWVNQKLLGSYYFDQQNGRYYYLLNGKKVYAVGN